MQAKEEQTVDEKKSPINTSKEDKQGILAAMIVMGQDKFITDQEAEGQREFVSSSTLPTKMSAADKAELEAAGVKFLGPVEGDPLFQHVELPEGWKRQATDHEMWSDLADDAGKVRARVFYKAAFYDRKAHLQLAR